MIKSFKHKGLENFYQNGSLKGIQPKHTNRLSALLFYLNAMTSTKDLESATLRFHRLKGDMQNLYSITVQANWRLTFEFHEDTKDVYIVDYQDYH